MAISAPGAIISHGIRWRVQGIPLQSRTTINVLRQGRYADCLDLPTRRRAARLLRLELHDRAPVDTGSLRQSIVSNGEYVHLGPRPYNRQRLKAIRAGRTYKQRKRGPVVKAKYYALPANVTSHMPEYIEEAIEAVSEQIEQLCLDMQAAERETFDLDVALAGTRASFSGQILRGAQPPGIPPDALRARRRSAARRSSGPGVRRRR